MDKANRFFTPTLYRMVRLDWLVIMIALSIIAAMHWREINWWLFLIVFWWIDFVGTAPGMYYQGRHPERPVPRWTIVLYNFCHSFTTVGVITAIWYAFAGFQWEMLAMPIHLAGDRCVFGNIYKHFDPRFEPHPDPGYQRFESEFLNSRDRGVSGSAVSEA